MADLNGGQATSQNVEGAGADKPGSAPVTAPNTTASNQNGQAGGSPAPGTESFTSLDVSKLPKELQESYNSMLKDYRSKTEGLANLKRQYEQDKQYAEAYKKALAEQQNRQQELITDQEFEEAFTSKDKFLALQQKLAQMQVKSVQNEVQQTRRQLEIREAERVLDSFANAKNEKGEPLNPLYEKLEQSGLIEYQIAKEEQQRQMEGKGPISLEEYPQVLAKVYASAAQIYNSIYNEGKDAGLGRVREKVNNSSLPPTNVPPNLPANIDFKKMSERDQIKMALEQARTELASKRT